MQVLHYLQNVLITHWSVVLAYLSAGGGVSVALQFLKRLRKWESAAWVEFVLGIFTVSAASINYIVNNYTTSPLPTIFGNFAPKILLAALVLHRLVVSPLFTVLEKNVVPFFNALKKVNNELKAAKAPAPVVDTTTFES